MIFSTSDRFCSFLHDEKEPFIESCDLSGLGSVAPVLDTEEDRPSERPGSSLPSLIMAAVRRHRHTATPQNHNKLVYTG